MRSAQRPDRTMHRGEEKAWGYGGDIQPGAPLRVLLRRRPRTGKSNSRPRPMTNGTATVNRDAPRGSRSIGQGRVRRATAPAAASAHGRSPPLGDPGPRLDAFVEQSAAQPPVRRAQSGRAPTRRPGAGKVIVLNGPADSGVRRAGYRWVGRFRPPAGHRRAASTGPRARRPPRRSGRPGPTGAFMPLTGATGC